MGLEVRISGAAKLRQVAAQIKATGDKGLGRQMSKALGEATEPVKAAITASANETMPSGYKVTLTRSLRYRRSQKTSARTASLTLKTFADGQKERRDLPSLERGRLRHPVFGRYRDTKFGLRKNPWANTAIKPGFHKRGTENAGDEAQKRLGAVLDDFAERLAKG